MSRRGKIGNHAVIKVTLRTSYRKFVAAATMVTGCAFAFVLIYGNFGNTHDTSAKGRKGKKAEQGKQAEQHKEQGIFDSMVEYSEELKQRYFYTIESESASDVGAYTELFENEIPIQQTEILQDLDNDNITIIFDNSDEENFTFEVFDKDGNSLHMQQHITTHSVEFDRGIVKGDGTTYLLKNLNGTIYYSGKMDLI